MRIYPFTLFLTQLLPACGGLVADDIHSDNAASGGPPFVTAFVSSGGAVGTGSGGLPSSGGCANAPVTFQVRPPVNSAIHWCISGILNNLWWADISNNSSGSLMLQDFCTPSCDSCATPDCSGITGQLPAELGDGLTEVWDGNYVIYVAATACDVSLTRCAKTVCAAPGQYTLTVCGYRDSASSQSEPCQRTPTVTELACFSRNFQYPANAPVVQTMPAE